MQRDKSLHLVKKRGYIRLVKFTPSQYMTFFLLSSSMPHSQLGVARLVNVPVIIRCKGRRVGHCPSRVAREIHGRISSKLRLLESELGKVQNLCQWHPWLRTMAMAAAMGHPADDTNGGPQRGLSTCPPPESGKAPTETKVVE